MGKSRKKADEDISVADDDIIPKVRALAELVMARWKRQLSNAPPFCHNLCCSTKDKASLAQTLPVLAWKGSMAVIRFGVLAYSSLPLHLP